MKVFQMIIFTVVASYVNADCSNKTSVIKKGQEYQMFFKKATSHRATVECKKWGGQWKSLTADLMQDIDDELQGCLQQMIVSANRKYANSQNAGYFLGGLKTTVDEQVSNDNNSSGWRWHSGRKIKKWEGMQPNSSVSTSTERRCMAALIRGVGSNTKAGDWVDQNCNTSMFYICQRELPADLVWGFSGNNHAVVPDEWSSIENAGLCTEGSRQSPVDINLRNRIENCGKNEISTAVEWATEGDAQVEWIVTNTARMVEIKFNPPRKLYTSFHGSSDKHFVDYIHIKWGANSTSGSEHTLQGSRVAGELQIFHHPNAKNETHAMAFMIQQRTFQPNKRWAPLISHIIRAQEAKTFSVLPSPSNHIRRLLEDSSNIRFYSSPDYIMGYGVRYHGSLTQPPCTENVIWTVYPRTITLSHSQFQVLRHLHMEGKEDNHFRLMRQTTREIQSQWNPSCCGVSE